MYVSSTIEDTIEITTRIKKILSEMYLTTFLPGEGLTINEVLLMYNQKYSILNKWGWLGGRIEWNI